MHQDKGKRQSQDCYMICD